MTRSRKLLSARGAPALLASSILARLPLAMTGIALLVHAQRLTGSFAVAGAASAAYAISMAMSAPVIGGMIDRRGQTRVLVAGATLTAISLIVDGLLAPHPGSLVLVGLAAATGLTTPPLDACMSTLLPSLVEDRDELPTLFAFESTAVEVTFIAGPPLALGVGTLWSTGGALCLSGLVILGGTLLFALQPASRGWRPRPADGQSRGGALQSAPVRTLALTLLGTGAAFGATEVGVTATAHALSSPGAAGPLLGLWGAGSLLGGIATTRLGGSARTGRGLTLLLAALAAAHGALILTTGSLAAMAVVITLAGATIAPTVSSVYAMVEGAAPAGTSTEAYSWLVTASLSGAALGAAIAGSLVQGHGPSGAFAAVGVAGGLAWALAGLRSSSLPAQSPGSATGLLARFRGPSRPKNSRQANRRMTAPSPAPTRSAELNFPAPASPSAAPRRAGPPVALAKNQA